MSEQPKPRSERKDWTQEEDVYIREHFDTTTFAELAACVGRSIGSIQSRCSVLKLKKSETRRKQQESIERPSGTISFPRPGVTVHTAKYGHRIKY
jgi:hypothetical protein